MLALGNPILIPCCVLYFALIALGFWTVIAARNGQRTLSVKIGAWLSAIGGGTLAIASLTTWEIFSIGIFMNLGISALTLIPGIISLKHLRPSNTDMGAGGDDHQ